MLRTRTFIAAAVVLGAAAACRNKPEDVKPELVDSAGARNAVSGAADSAALAASGQADSATGVVSAAADSAGGAMAGAADSAAGVVGGAATGAAAAAGAITDVSSAISLLGQGNITSMSPTQAVPIVNNLSSKLGASGIPELTSISTDLSALSKQLTSGSIDGPAVGSLLSSLGQKTTAVSASQLAGAASGTLGKLGSLLTTAGSQLAGGK
jgi:hypothetical protein